MNIILSAIAAVAFATPALTAEVTHAYPRLPGDASDLRVEYAPGARGNVVGGGAAVFIGVDDGRPVFAYAPAARAQQALPGTPALENLNGELHTVYVPGQIDGQRG